MEKREALNQTALEPLEGSSDLDKIIDRIQESLSGEDEKSSVPDLIRLLEIRHELGQSQPVRLTVRWIDACQTPASDE